MKRKFDRKTHSGPFIIVRWTRPIVMLLLVFVSAVSVLQRGYGQSPEFDKVADEAFRACAELAKFNRGQEGSPFDFRAITVYGKLADAFLIKNAPDRARTVLLFSLDEKEATRITKTTAVKFGAPIPSIPEAANQADSFLWKLETFISLAHGHRYSEASKFLRSFDQKYQRPVFQLRYMKIIAENCIKTNNKDEGRKIASQIWQESKKLGKNELQQKLDYGIFLVELAQKLDLSEPAKKLVHAVNTEFGNGTALGKIPQETQFRLCLRLGLALARLDHFEEACLRLELASALTDQIEDEYFEKESGRARVALALAETYRQHGNNERALKYTQSALAWTDKAKQKSLDSKSIAESLDGGTGFFSKALSLGLYSDYKSIVLEQIQCGNQELAMETWASMPLSFQKLICQIEASRLFLASKNKAAIRESAQRCMRLESAKTALIERIAFRAAAANIYQIGGLVQSRDQLIDEMFELVVDSDNEIAKQNFASELVALHQFKQAYRAIQLIKLPRNRALPLASLARELAVQSQ